MHKMESIASPPIRYNMCSYVGTPVCVMSEAVAHLCYYTDLMVSWLLLLFWSMVIAYAVIKVISSIKQASATDKQANRY